MSVSVSPRELGRYVLYDQIAAGGMATVHFGRMQGAVGFSRLVAIKRLHPNYASDAHFVQMFLDEARLAARLDHPNVVSTLDVVADENEVFLVMEHVLGEALEAVMPRVGSPTIPLPVASAIICGVLEGLHSAHEACGDMGEPLEIVHRDVSPHNILVGVDGVPRVFDFGIAKAAINTQETREGVIKGKVTYMAPEQVRGLADRRADLYAAGVILWELAAGRRRHAGERNDALFLKLARNDLPPPQALTTIRDDAPAALDAVIARATDPSPDARFATAREMAVALEAAVPPAPARDVAAWIRDAARTRIERVSSVMRRIESDIQASSDSKLLSVRPSSTGSVHVVTATIRRSGATSSNPAPEEVRASDRPIAPPQRSWTMPAALLAFTAALLLVGLRVLTRHDAPARSEHSEAANAELSTTSVAAAKSTEPEANPAMSSGAEASSAELPGADAGAARAAAPATTVAPPRVIYAAPPPAARPATRDVATAAPTGRVETPAVPATSNGGHKPGCENPFAIGADGIRQIKPECL
jgi:eukaryotic-like serine/threonine-protein kinase